jgi:hypothetical protein
MSIAETVLAKNKLRQERHGNERCKHRRNRAGNQIHAAPDGAWMVGWGSSPINMALLTELGAGRRFVRGRGGGGAFASAWGSGGAPVSKPA